MFIIKDSVIISNASDALVYPLFVVSWVVMIAAVVLTIGSMLDYFVKAKDLLGFGKGVSSEISNEDSTSKDDSAKQSACGSLAQAVIESAIEKGVSLATAESLTGGLISSCLTSIPGSSSVMRGGIVSYSSDVKRDVLDVDRLLLERDGAVNERVACEMAEGARMRLEADYAVAATGIAGPEGDGSGVPVGTVWIAVASNGCSQARCYHFEGDRREVRELSVDAALNQLLEAMSFQKA